MRRCVSCRRSTGSASSSGSASSTRPKRLPSSRGSGWSSGRRLNGTIAWISEVTSPRRSARGRRRRAGSLQCPPAQPAGDRGDEHVVDGRVVGARDPSHVGQRDRAATTRRARQDCSSPRSGPRVGRRRELLRERLRDAGGAARELAERATGGGASRRPRARARPLSREPASSAGASGPAARPSTLRSRSWSSRSIGEVRHVARLVGQREHHARERDPVGDAVVHARDDRARRRRSRRSGTHVPQRLASGRAVAPSGRRRAPAARPRSPGGGSATWWRCRSRSKCGSSSQCGAAERAAVDDALRKRGKRSTSRSRGPSRSGSSRDRLLEPQHARDHHQVLRAVHPQPGRVGARHRVSGHAATVRLRASCALRGTYGSGSGRTAANAREQRAHQRALLGAVEAGEAEDGGQREREQRAADEAGGAAPSAAAARRRRRGRRARARAARSAATRTRRGRGGASAAASRSASRRRRRRARGRRRRSPGAASSATSSSTLTASPTAAAGKLRVVTSARPAITTKITNRP